MGWHTSCLTWRARAKRRARVRVCLAFACTPTETAACAPSAPWPRRRPSVRPEASPHACGGGGGGGVPRGQPPPPSSSSRPRPHPIPSTSPAPPCGRLARRPLARATLRARARAPGAAAAIACCGPFTSGNAHFLRAKRTEERFRFFVSLFLLFLADASAGKIDRVYRASEALVGVSRGDMSGSICAPQDRHRTSVGLARLVTTHTSQTCTCMRARACSREPAR